MKDLTRLARPEILALKAYESARSLVSSQLLSQNARVYLDANESPFSEGGLNRYPEPQPPALVDRFCELYDVDSSQLVIGRGSDEAIDLLVRAFCRPGQDSILICPPTYGVYEISAQIQGAKVIRVPLLPKERGYSLDEPEIISSAQKKENDVKIVFLCSPNNPTGTAFDPKSLARICSALSEHALVVVDEAYAEFSDQLSMTSQLDLYPNLVVLRTLSKAWALAAARCGVAIGAPELISLLHKVRAPYPLPSPAVQAVLAATDSQSRARLQAQVQTLQRSRQQLAVRLGELPGVLEILDSKANFILVRFRNDGASTAVMKAARDSGIILRDRSRDPGLQNCVRITVGTAAENEAVVAVLKGVCS